MSVELRALNKKARTWKQQAHCKHITYIVREQKEPELAENNAGALDSWCR